MKKAITLTILFSVFLIFCSGQNSINENLAQNKFEISSDTTIMIFQNFYKQTLISEFDTVAIIISYETNKTTITRNLYSSGNGDYTIIYKIGNQYTIEKESSNSKCKINNIESDYYNMRELLIGSCWLQSKGLPLLDSGVGIILSTLYGEILYKGFQSNFGQVIYSINGIIIPITQRQELLEMILK